MKQDLLHTLLLALLLTPVLVLLSHWSLSKPINDPVVQGFYDTISVKSNDFGLPSVLHERIIELNADGFSSKDYLDLNATITVYCGGEPISFIQEQTTTVMYGFMSIFTEINLIHEAMIISDGKMLIDQLDATLCGEST